MKTNLKKACIYIQAAVNPDSGKKDTLDIIKDTWFCSTLTGIVNSVVHTVELRSRRRFIQSPQFLWIHKNRNSAYRLQSRDALVLAESSRSA